MQVERARVAVEVALQRHGDAQIVAQWGTAALKRLKRNKPRTSIRVSMRYERRTHGPSRTPSPYPYP